MTKHINVDTLDHIKEIIQMAKVVNMEYHGRPDCKNCILMETIEEVLQPETPEERKKDLHPDRFDPTIETREEFEDRISDEW